VEHEDIEISQLVVGATLEGIYRGQKVHRFPAFHDETEEFIARIFLDTGRGPVAVQVDEHAIQHIDALRVVDGDLIAVTRSTDHAYQVAKEVP
jgi:hypothetical protein